MEVEQEIVAGYKIHARLITDTSDFTQFSIKVSDTMNGFTPKFHLQQPILLQLELVGN
jgi:hypothetical protein